MRDVQRDLFAHEKQPGEVAGLECPRLVGTIASSDPRSIKPAVASNKSATRRNKARRWDGSLTPQDAECAPWAAGPRPVGHAGRGCPRCGPDQLARGLLEGQHMLTAERTDLTMAVSKRHGQLQRSAGSAPQHPVGHPRIRGRYTAFSRPSRRDLLRLGRCLQSTMVAAAYLASTWLSDSAGSVVVGRDSSDSGARRGPGAADAFLTVLARSRRCSLSSNTPTLNLVVRSTLAHDVVPSPGPCAPIDLDLADSALQRRKRALDLCRSRSVPWTASGHAQAAPRWV